MSKLGELAELIGAVFLLYVLIKVVDAILPDVPAHIGSFVVIVVVACCAVVLFARKR